MRQDVSMLSAMKNRIARMKTKAFLYSLASLLGAGALVFWMYAGYLHLSTVMRPETAALSAGAVLMVLSLLIVLWTRISPSGDRRARRRGDGPGGNLEQALGEQVDPVLGEWIRKHPGHAAIATLLLGAAAGYSRSTRHVLRDLYSQYVEAESERRDSRPH